MPDEFTETEVIGLGKNIGSSIKGVFIGIILFIAGIIILWVNEGRVNVGKVSEKLSVPLNADKIDVSYNGKFVSATGTFKSEGEIGDPEYINPGPYAVLHRKVEMYVWVEHKSTKTKKKVGGKTERVTTYRYTREWRSSPPDSSSFRHPEGHENPQLTIKPASFYAHSAKIGAYTIDLKSVRLPSPQTISVTEDMLIEGAEGYIEGGYIFNGEGTLNKPVVGDIRISYSAIPNTFSPATVFGKVEGSSIVPYLYKGKKKIYRLFRGSRDEAIAKMKTEHKIITWILRLVGFFLIWIGLSALFGPIFALLDILPFLGNITRTVVNIITFIVALILSIIIILVSMIAHNLIALLVTIVVVIGIFILFFHRKKKKAIKASV